MARMRNIFTLFFATISSLIEHFSLFGECCICSKKRLRKFSTRQHHLFRKWDAIFETWSCYCAATVVLFY